MRLYNATVHPYVLEPEEELNGSRGASAMLGITLFGRAVGHLPLVFRVFNEAGRAGLGSARVPYRIQDVLQESPSQPGQWSSILSAGALRPLNSSITHHIPETPEQVAIRFVTPLRLRGNGSLVNVGEFQFHHLFRNLLRRISMLCYFHDVPLETDFAGLVKLSREISFHHKQVGWRDLSRWSSRQQTEMTMGGLVGQAQLSNGLVPFWPYLYLGQWTHTGKGAAMGLGRYSLQTASLQEACSEVNAA